MKIWAGHFFILTLSISLNAYGFLYHENSDRIVCAVNVYGNIDVYEHADPQQILLQKKKLQLEHDKLQLEHEKINLQKNADRFQWELQIKERDELLQQQAMLKNDGKCCDYFCEKRCKSKASNSNFCAKHFREIQKGIKEQKYKAVSRKRFFFSPLGIAPSS